MNVWRSDPGPCVVCGKAHSGCGAGPIEIVQRPCFDAATAAAARPAAPLEAERVQATLPAGQFTTGTYRRVKRGTTKGAATT